MCPNDTPELTQSQLTLNQEGPNPSGLCKCGCGGKTRIATANSTAYGTIKGHPVNFINGHQRRKTYAVEDGPNPSGLCMCGCGQPAPLAKATSKRKGTVKGQPTCFIHNHHMNGSRNNKYRPLMERFWSFVDKRGPDDCWEWTGSHHGGGYGLIGINRRSIRTHRFSYELHNGPIPKGMEVRHTCDNPPCVNPKHLVLGTHQDNMDDMYSKDRRKSAKGEASGAAKLTEDQVRDIRQRRANGETGVALAREFGVTTAAICAIYKRKIWKHVT